MVSAEASATTDLLVGRSVGNYRIERRLGQGGMGAVYLLRHDRLPDTFAALKIQLGEGHLRERFEQEAMAAAAVGSHRVVKPIDLGQLDDGRPYIVMEFVPGRSLDRALQEDGPFSSSAALTVITRVADTMVLAHQKGIIHRDLKPQNIMLVEGDDDPHQVKLLDFGVARATGPIKLAHTLENAVIGTPGYMSPEAVAGGVVDGRGDVFSLGVILYELLTGALPFPAPSAEEAILNVLSLPTPRVADQRPETLPPVPPEIDLLLGKALQKKPASRPTMAEFHRLTVALLARLAREDGRPPGGTPASLIAVAPDPHHEAPTLSGPSEHLEALLDRLVATPSSPDGGLRRRVTDELTPLGDPGPRLTADGAGPRLTADRAGPRLTADEPALARATPEPPLEPAADPAPALLPATLHLAALPPQAAPAAAATAGPPRRPVVLVTLGVALGIALLALAISLIRPRPSGGAFADALAPTTAPPPAAPAAPPRPAHPVLPDGGPAPAAKSPAHDAGKGKRNGAHPPRGFKGLED